MNKERLLKLADMLKADAKNPTGIKFDLETWAYAGGKKKFPKSLKALDCKTTACAVGLACLSGEFAADGLRWRPSECENNIVPLYSGNEGFYAVEKFFDINAEQAMWLFATFSYREDKRTGAEGELAVALRIRSFVAGKASPPKWG